MKLENIEEVKQFFKDNPANSSMGDSIRFSSGLPRGPLPNLRLDWKVNVSEGTDYEQEIDDGFAFLENDLDELLEYGDVDKVSDPLLSSFDGSRKRGVEWALAGIEEAILVKQYSFMKNTNEYTLFLRLYAE